MKRIKRLALVVCSFLFILVLTGCSKNAIGVEDFQKIAEDKGFTVKDYSSVAQGEGGIESFLVVTNKDGNVAGTYVKYESEDKAKTEYEAGVKSIEANKGSSSANTSVNIGNYNTYTLKTEGKYYIIERVDSTMVLFEAEEGMKKAVDDLFKAIGY